MGEENYKSVYKQFPYDTLKKWCIKKHWQGGHVELYSENVYQGKIYMCVYNNQGRYYKVQKFGIGTQTFYLPYDECDDGSHKLLPSPTEMFREPEKCTKK